MCIAAICQENFNLYDDLDVVIDAEIEIVDFNRVVTLNVNGTEIKIEGETADRIYNAIESRISNFREQQKKDYIEWCNDVKAWEYFEEKRYMREG